MGNFYTTEEIFFDELEVGELVEVETCGRCPYEIGKVFGSNGPAICLMVSRGKHSIKRLIYKASIISIRHLTDEEKARYLAECEDKKKEKK